VRHRFWSLLTLAAVVAVASLILGGPEVERELPAAVGAGAAPPETTVLPAFRAPAGDRLSPQVAASQMLAVSFYGTRITPGLRHLILDEKVGTVLLFSPNFDDAGSLLRLTSELHTLGEQARLPAPLIVAVDEEGGRVMRVTDGVSPLPAAAVLGQRGPAGVRAAVASTARGLNRLGVDWDLAPVADLRTNPFDAVIGDRSFGSDPARTGPLVAAAVQGLHDGGVAATLKHFPGLGGAAGDPHAAMPVDPVSLDRWLVTQARSFGAGIAAGADAVMTTAVVAPGLDPSGTPAMFSAPVVRLLRERLGFQGVVVADSLVMGAVTARYSLAQATVAAASAGNDLLLLADGDTAAEDAALRALQRAVVVGPISEEQVQASAARVIALRRRWGGDGAGRPPLAAPPALCSPC
jgi:beta-N-acetylhexosaminidase